MPVNTIEGLHVMNSKGCNLLNIDMDLVTFLLQAE